MRGTRKLTVYIYIADWDTWWRRWFRYCATSRKVAISILSGVIVSFLFT